MLSKSRHKRICAYGHIYYKSSDCPVCPECEKNNKPTSGFLSEIPSPARRALTTHGIVTPGQLSAFSEPEILKLHGIGPASLPALRKALELAGLRFKKHSK